MRIIQKQYRSFLDRNKQRVRVGDEILYYCCAGNTNVGAFTQTDNMIARLIVRGISHDGKGLIRVNNGSQYPILMDNAEVERIPKINPDEFVMLKMLEGYYVVDGNKA